MVGILPLKPGALERARELLAQGPPFDPEAAGLERHLVFLTNREVVFLFEASTQSVSERLEVTVDLWTAHSDWKELVAGRPRLAENAYAWEQRASSDDGDFSFAATPGPGDSEGGDIFSP